MRFTTWHKLTLAVAFAAAATYNAPALAVTASVSFQNGANGYNGTFDRRIDERDGTNNVNGSMVPHYFVDGYQPDNPETSGNEYSPDEQNMLRFDNIIGNGPGQIPTGATILSASLTITTSPAGNSQTPGPWGIAQLLQPFDTNTTYFGNFDCGGCELGSRGPWWQDGYSNRPSGGFGPQDQAGVDTADMRAIVQSWADGATNHGIAIQAGFTGVTDGWGINTTGYPLPQGRPRLSVTYTTDPVELNTLQNGLNGYAGNSMALVQSGAIALVSATNPDPSVDDLTTDGLTLLDQTFLDGPQFSDTIGNLSSHDNLALIKFDDIFGNGAGQAPTDIKVGKAWLVLTTGDASADARSSGVWSVNRMLRDWDSSSLHSSFGSDPGLQALDGDVSAPLDMKAGMITGSEVWFDVTSYLEGVRTGATDYGLAVMSAGTADGWQIHFNGSSETSARPRLVIASTNSAISNPTLVGDFNGNGTVDAADYTTWRDNLGGTHNLNGNGEETGGSGGIVDEADYALWKAHFGETASGVGGTLGAAVPEPASLWMAAAAMLGLVGMGRRK